MLTFIRKFDVIFYCSHHVDEIWIRSTVYELCKKNLKIALIFSGEVPDETKALYSDLKIKIFSVVNDSIWLKFYYAPVLISASTSLKRQNFSNKIKYFCHMPHSLISLHGAYPEDAFDSFNVLFAANEGQEVEFRAIAEMRGIAIINTFLSGYGKLDVLVEEGKGLAAENKHVLIAPSWGKGNIIETGLCLQIVKQLLSMQYKVTLRPHSAIVLYQPEKLAPFLELDNNLFSIERFTNSKAIFTSSILITDYSGIYFEYHAINPRKILFIETPKKIFNNQFCNYKIPLLEVEARSSLGIVCPPDLDIVIKEITNENTNFHNNHITKKLFFNVGNCGKHVSKKILEVLL